MACNLNISNTGLSLIKKYEGLRLKAYKCPAGVWTIGYGHTKNVKSGMTCTREQADAWLLEDVQTAVLAVRRAGEWGQHEFDALVSFTFNCGAGNLSKLVKNRRKSQIADALLLYNKGGGKVLLGLQRRRTEERKLFLMDGLNETYYPAYKGSGSLDQIMGIIGADKDYDYTQSANYKRRTPIATANGISDYKGTYVQNKKLLNLIKEGKLKRP